MKHRPKGEPGLELRPGLKDRSSGLCGDHTAALGPEARVPAQGTGLRWDFTEVGFRLLPRE